MTNIINDDLRNQRKKKKNPENVNTNILHIGEKTKHLSMIGLAPTKRSDKTVAPKQSSPLDKRLWGDLCNSLTTMEINVLIKTHSKINYS